MLVLSRKPGESIEILCETGEVVRLVYLSEKGNGVVRLGVDAPKSMQIARSELCEKWKMPKSLTKGIPAS